MAGEKSIKIDDDVYEKKNYFLEGGKKYLKNILFLVR